MSDIHLILMAVIATLFLISLGHTLHVRNQSPCEDGVDGLPSLVRGRWVIDGAALSFDEVMLLYKHMRFYKDYIPNEKDIERIL